MADPQLGTLVATIDQLQAETDNLVRKLDLLAISLICAIVILGALIYTRA
jgi:hypothetical protein